MSEKAHLKQFLSAIREAKIAWTANAHVQSYTTEIQGVTYRSFRDLEKAERNAMNRLSRLDRGSMFGKVGFARAK